MLYSAKHSTICIKILYGFTYMLQPNTNEKDTGGSKVGRVSD